MGIYLVKKEDVFVLITCIPHCPSR